MVTMSKERNAKIVKNIQSKKKKEKVIIAGPIAKQSKSSDLDCGRGDPGSNPSEDMYFFGMVN